MATAAETSRELIDVDVAGAPKGDLHLAIAKVPEEDRHPRAGDRSRMLDHAVEVLRADAMALEGARAHRQPGDATRLVDTEAPQYLREQTHASGRCRRVDALVHLLGIDTPRQQITGDRVAPRRRVAVAKGPRVREDRRIQRPGDLRGDRQIELAGEVVDELPRRTCRGVRENDVAGRIVGGNMVVDDEPRNR